jgi:hypothetical protein
MSDYLPRTDADFSDWLHNFVTYANANLADLGLVAADLTPVQTASTDFDTAMQANDAMQAQAQGTSSTKDGKRSTAEDLARALVARIQNTP